MKYAIQIDSTNRIEHATFAKYVTPENADKYILVDTLPTGETEQEKNIRNYLYIDDRYVYDPLPEPESPKVTAPRNIIAGEYITVTGVLYKATMNIPNGEPIIVGQNAVVTTVEEQLYELMKGE